MIPSRPAREIVDGVVPDGCTSEARYGAREKKDGLSSVIPSDWVGAVRAATLDLLADADRATKCGRSVCGLMVPPPTADPADAPDRSVEDTTVETITVAAGAIQPTSPLTSDRPLSFPRPLLIRPSDDGESASTHLKLALAGCDTDFPWTYTHSVIRRLSCAPETRCRLMENRPPIQNVRSRLGNTVFAETAPTPGPLELGPARLEVIELP